MLNQPVILGFVPTTSVAMGGGAWAVTAAVDDPLEINDGWAIARGDVIFLDQRASTSAPNTVGRYTINSIVSKSSGTVSVVLEWDAAGAPVAPNECLGVRGYLAQPVDVAGTVRHPRQQTVLIAQEMIDLAKQVEQLALGTDAEDSELVITRFAAEAIQAGQFVKVLPSGSVVVAIPQDPERMPANGMSLVSGSGMVRVRVAGITPRITTSLLSGAPVFVGDGGLPTTDPAGITLPAAVQIMGVALDESSMALAVTGALIKRA